MDKKSFTLIPPSEKPTPVQSVKGKPEKPFVPNKTRRQQLQEIKEFMDLDKDQVVVTKNGVTLNMPWDSFDTMHNVLHAAKKTISQLKDLDFDFDQVMINIGALDAFEAFVIPKKKKG